jgi:uncharacterized iron-regulated membrane protein
MTIKIIWAAAALTVPLLFVTGYIMWWNRVVSEKWSRLRSVAGDRKGDFRFSGRGMR